ncbi:hypothetical protein BP5796_10019 [Coleophoma crateriformis]|uniref:Nicotianamine synthase n=1 Tax=Coleophoma crateriformis TaxID=565419 RepID=A0A3D8QU79_9HELO|nr:hypothetical protein BP5796_10019 [Coleophoma crateriformis]
MDLLRSLFASNVLKSSSIQAPISATGKRQNNHARNKSTPANAEAEQSIGTILQIHATLLARGPALHPCEVVNEAFGQLVGLCARILPESVVSRVREDPRIIDILPSLRHICATAESHLEAYWAAQISEAEDANQALKAFPYYQNYVDLTRMELNSILSISPRKPQKIAFIGSGPLPLTSLCLDMALNGEQVSDHHSPAGLNATGQETIIFNIDQSRDAITQSTALYSKLSPTDDPATPQPMQFQHSEASSPITNLAGFDVVYLAALVGLTVQDKEDILISVVKKMDAGALLVVRSAWGLRGCLYPEFDPTSEAVLQHLNIQLVVHPYNHVVNSVIVARVK